MRESSLIDRKINSLYVHIPFCEHICFYCDFVKIKKPTEKEVVENYLEKLEIELLSYKNQLDSIKSIYIGGGTPSCLDLEQTKKMCNIFLKLTEGKNLEYTIELNPESVTKEKLSLYKEFNINRLSIGVQTFDNDLLKKIGRIHNNETTVNTFNIARELGFENISLDLMYNLYDQTKENILIDLEWIQKLKPDHISWYSLIMKENSIWGRKKMKLPENDENFDLIVNEGLNRLGYKRYEISNYALSPEKRSIHNMTYWDNSLFAGIGIGASGFELIDGYYFLTKNEGNIVNYRKTYEKLSQKDYFFQIFMMGLRLVEGIDVSIAINKGAFDFFKPIIDKKIDEKLLELIDNKLRCTERGFNILNEILIDFL